MISDYRDHAANERTYLAWIRTGITIMTLGFFIEKFDVYLAKLRAAAASSVPAQVAKPGIHAIAVLLVVLGIAILAAGTYRFVAVRRKLETQSERPYAGVGYALALSGTLGFVGLVLLLFLLRVI